MAYTFIVKGQTLSEASAVATALSGEVQTVSAELQKMRDSINGDIQMLNGTSDTYAQIDLDKMYKLMQTQKEKMEKISLAMKEAVLAEEEASKVLIKKVEQGMGILSKVSTVDVEPVTVGKTDVVLPAVIAVLGLVTLPKIDVFNKAMPIIDYIKKLWIKVEPIIAPKKTYKYSAPLLTANLAVHSGGIYRKYSNGKIHNGIDLAAKQGTTVLAVTSGVIEWIGWDKPRDGGLTLALMGDDGLYYNYSHLQSTSVNVGSRVEAGQSIALSGRSFRGSYTIGVPEHLHLSISVPDKSSITLPIANPKDGMFGMEAYGSGKWGKAIDPMAFLKKHGITLWVTSSLYSSPLPQRSLYVTAGFPYYSDGRTQHPGADFAATVGTAVGAIVSGKILFCDWERLSGGGYAMGGRCLCLLGDDGFYYYYAHLSRYNCNKNDRVTAGQIIAYSGKSSKGIDDPTNMAQHLHLSIGLPKKANIKLPIFSNYDGFINGYVGGVGNGEYLPMINPVEFLKAKGIL